MIKEFEKKNDKIVDRRVSNEGKIEYLLKWKDYRRRQWVSKEYVDSDMINEFEKKFVKKIDKIVDKRVSIDGKIEYLLKWKGFSDYNNTWELVEHISNSDLIKEFEKQFVKKIDESVDKR